MASSNWTRGAARAAWPRGFIQAPARAPIIPIEAKFVDAVLDFTIDLSCAIDPTVDFPASASLACAPSGAGEMAISALSVVDDAVTYTAAGGQPGRLYRLKLIVSMTDGRVFVFEGEQPVLGYLPSDRPQTNFTIGFGDAITWTAPPRGNFLYLAGGNPLQLLTGGNLLFTGT